ncbi:DUF805 domain-containing protein [Veillonella rodentium]|uniref:Predicted membrane protein n=1 Tax=Veillonella rodentium TaxID=248315 RepID=A0A239ZD07_9FIRM|nr:DUF805 domain-containing protein [Veillonella rodentium]SNV68496.1 Predicted membrane protein [Veillonella rodentium]
MIDRETALLKQNIYDLLHNTRIRRNDFLFILIGCFFTYFIGNGVINNLSLDCELMYYVRYIYKLLGVGVVLELSRRRLHDFGCSGKWLCIWSLIGGVVYARYYYELYSVEGLYVSFFEQIFLVELAIIFIPLVLLYFLPSNQFHNKYGDSRVQMVSSECSIGYLSSKIALANEKGILEYLMDIYIYQLFCFNGRAKRVEAIIGVASLSTIMTLNVNILSILLTFKNAIGVAWLTPISLGIFFLLYFYTIFSILMLFARRLHDSLYSTFWLILLPIPFLNIFIIYRLFVKGSWDIRSSIKESS